MKTKSKNIQNGIQECQAEAKALENKNANFIVFLLRPDAFGNDCFIYEKCDDRNLKRNLPGISFQIRPWVNWYVFGLMSIDDNWLLYFLLASRKFVSAKYISLNDTTHIKTNQFIQINH